MQLVVASLVVLVAGATACALAARHVRASLTMAASAIIIASLLCVAAAVRVLWLDAPVTDASLLWPLPLGAARLHLDGLSAWFLLTVAALSISVAIYTHRYMRSEHTHGSIGAFAACLCLLVMAMILLLIAADAVLFLLAWEAMTLAAFVLVGFRHRQPTVQRAAWMYIVATHLGTALGVIPMFGILIAHSGSTLFDSFRGAAAGMSPATASAAFVLALLGFGTKAGIMPMHVWLPVAHPAAPTPISALLSGVVIKTGIYGILRTITWLPPLPMKVGSLVLIVGVVSGVLGVLYALAQHDLKRLLAYHSVENIGIIMLGIGVGIFGQATRQPGLAALGFAGALLHVLNHALFKGLLFLSAGAVIHATGTGQIERLGGIARRTPTNAMLFLIGAVAICGLPPLNGLVSEWLIYGSLLTGALSPGRTMAGLCAIGIVGLALMGGLALACFAKVFGVVFLGEPRDASLTAHHTPGALKSSMALLAGACVIIGVLPPAILRPLCVAGAALTGAAPDEIAARLAASFAPLGRLTIVAAVLITISAALLLVRRARRTVFVVQAQPVGTWGCGFAAPTPRMQYTATSFAQSLIQSFWHLLWPQRVLQAPEGVFAGRSHVETHAPDLAEQDLFAPVFRGAARLFRIVRTASWSGDAHAAAPTDDGHGHVGPMRFFVRTMLAALRRGGIHVYLAFLVIALVFVFLVEVTWAPGTAGAADAQIGVRP